jgi:integrase
MITLSPDDTKEGHWKRVPIHHALAPILRESLKVTCFGSEKVFHLIDNKGIRPLDVETFKNVWPRAMATLKFKAPLPRFHDLRHTWKTNARRSRMDSEIRESILGHGERGLSVRERYGRIDDGELLNAIDHMTFDHGETEIFVARKSGATTTPEKCKQIVNKPLRTKKKSGSG